MVELRSELILRPHIDPRRAPDTPRTASGSVSKFAMQAVVQQTSEFLRRVPSERSGRPTSPINRVSPVSTAIGSGLLSKSVTTILTLSNVWPGVCAETGDGTHEFHDIAVTDRAMGKRRARTVTEIDRRAGTRSASS